MSEPESPQGEWGARRTGWLALAPVRLSEERAQRELESLLGEWGARRAGWLAAPRGGAGPGGVPVSRSEERA